MKFRQDIQVLRGLAVLGVVLFHIFPTTFKSGYLGVDLFFVISGFLLTPSIQEIVSSEKEVRRRLFKEFYERRFARLAPTLIIVVLGFSLWMLIFGPLGEQRYAFIQGLTSLLYVANFEAFRLSQGSYFHPDPNGLLHTWSLSAEEQVFVILPLVFIFLMKSLRIKFNVSVFITFTCGFVFYILINFSTLFENLPYFIGNPEFFYFSPIFRATEFLLGSIIVTKFQNRLKISNRLYKFFLALDLGAVAFPMTHQILLVSVLILSSLILMNSRHNYQTGLTLQFFQAIGDASYSIYLLHLPIIFMAKHIASDHPLIEPSLPYLALMASVFAGWFSFQYIEKTFKVKLLSYPVALKKYAVICLVITPILILGGLRLGATKYYGLSKPPTLVGDIKCERGEDIGFCGNLQDNEKPKFLLIGDSHAAALSEVFRTQVSNNGGNPIIMFGRGCPLSIILDESGNVTPCEAYLNMVTNYISENEVTLIIAQRSSQEQWPNQETTRNLLKSIDYLSRYATKIYVISPNPEFRKGMSQGSLSSLFSNNGESDRIDLMKASFEDLKMLQASIKKTKISIVDSISMFCDIESCSYKKSGKYLYWDSNHLSRDGANLYSGFFSTLNSGRDRLTRSESS